MVSAESWLSLREGYVLFEQNRLDASLVSICVFLSIFPNKMHLHQAEDLREANIHCHAVLPKHFTDFEVIPPQIGRRYMYLKKKHIFIE